MAMMTKIFLSKFLSVFHHKPLLQTALLHMKVVFPFILLDNYGYLEHPENTIDL